MTRPDATEHDEQRDADLVARTVAAVRPADADAAAAAAREMDAKLKPPGSLGGLESLAARLAGIARTPRPAVASPVVVVCAADHGVVAQGVSAYPAEVTALMVQSFAAGGAAVCVLAAQAGARLVVADLGTTTAPEPVPGGGEVLDLRVRPGTADSSVGPAMTRAEALRALAAGIELGLRLVDEGADVLALGEMGIGNTTTAAVLTAALLDLPAALVSGRGTGLDDERLAHKVAVVQQVLDRHGLPDAAADPVDVLAAVGGLEVAALAGVTLAGASRGVPVLLDGFITGAAALVARALSPSSADALVASHLSVEPGHDHQLSALGVEPLLRLDLRLGEASGACLALPLLRSSVAVLDGMATFASLGLGE